MLNPPPPVLPPTQTHFLDEYRPGGLLSHWPEPAAGRSLKAYLAQLYINPRQLRNLVVGKDRVELVKLTDRLLYRRECVLDKTYLGRAVQGRGAAQLRDAILSNVTVKLTLGVEAPPAGTQGRSLSGGFAFYSNGRAVRLNWRLGAEAKDPLFARGVIGVVELTHKPGSNKQVLQPLDHKQGYEATPELDVIKKVRAGGAAAARKRPCP